MQNKIVELTARAKIEFQKNQFKEAAADFRSCLTMLTPDGEPLEIAEMRNNLGVSLVRSADYQTALDVLLGTDTVFAGAHETQKQGMALANIASAYAGLKEYDQAASAYTQAIECFKQCGDKKLCSITLRALSDLQLKSGKQYQAIGTLQAAYLEKPRTTLKDKFFSSALGEIIHKLLGY